ncbi:MAG: hypothetical protein LUD00_11240 [Prevotellaceae bacterium]|nr:hypothetical protein [Prevotellaceae bacterium]
MFSPSLVGHIACYALFSIDRLLRVYLAGCIRRLLRHKLPNYSLRRVNDGGVCEYTPLNTHEESVKNTPTKYMKTP